MNVRDNIHEVLGIRHMQSTQLTDSYELHVTGSILQMVVTDA